MREKRKKGGRDEEKYINVGSRRQGREEKKGERNKEWGKIGGKEKKECPSGFDLVKIEFRYICIYKYEKVHVWAQWTT